VRRNVPVGVALVWVAMLAAAVLLAYWGRGQWFGGDDLDYSIRLATESLGHALLNPPENKYLIAVPLLLYKALFGVFGIDSYVPYRIVGIALVLLCAGLLFGLLRKRVGDLVAIPPVLLMLFFGAGWAVVLTPVRIPSQIALAAGLGMMLALERRDRRGDLAAMVLLGVSLASHPVGISFAAAAGVMIVLRSAQGWHQLWIVVPPGILFAAWWLFLRPPTGETLVPNRASDIFPFVRQSWAALTAAITGLFGVVDEPAFHQPLAWVAAGALLALIALGVGWSWRRLPPTFWAAIVGLIVLMATTRLAPVGFLRIPDEPRYLYPEAFFLLIALGTLAGALRLRGWPIGLASAVLLISLWPNVDRLIDGGQFLRENSAAYRARWTAVELAGPDARPGYMPDQFSRTASAYLAAVRAYGRGGYSPSELPDRSARIRLLTDDALIDSIGISLAPARGAVPAAARSPRSQGTVVAAPDHGCVAVGGSGEGGAVESSELGLPAGGVWIGPGQLTHVSFHFGRFTDPPAIPLEPPSGPGPVVLRLPRRSATPPWELLIQSRRPVTVCGLAGIP
jgi:hypothetical protein